MKKKTALALAGGAAALLALAACQTTPPGPPLPLASQVDIPRFMGDWYVISAIPTMFEKNVYSPRDRYKLEADGTIATTYLYRADSFDGPEKSMGSTGFVLGGNGAIWGQQYIWPIKADYRVGYVSPDYTQTIIAREKRDYVWIMARTPTISEADYNSLVARVAQMGYDTTQLQRMPQRPS